MADASQQAPPDFNATPPPSQPASQAANKQPTTPATQPTPSGQAPPTFILNTGGFPGTTTKKVNPVISSSERLYLKIWGVQAPKGYLEALMHQGMNIYEIADHEMSKPAFRYTQLYRDNYAQLAGEAARVFGMR